MLRPIIIKIGGSLLKNCNGETLSSIGRIITESAAKTPVFIVPGGGPFADTVRQYGQQMNLSEETCHHMAMTAMDQFAYLLGDLIPGSEVIDLCNLVNISNQDELIYNQNSELFVLECSQDIILDRPHTPKILLCSGYFKQISAVDLPRSWDVTSDSVAAFLARRINTSMLIVLKSKDIDPELQEPDVDSFFRRLLPLKMSVWFINGLYPERLAELLQTGSTRGVYIVPESVHGQSSF